MRRLHGFFYCFGINNGFLFDPEEYYQGQYDQEEKTNEPEGVEVGEVKGLLVYCEVNNFMGFGCGRGNITTCLGQHVVGYSSYSLCKSGCTIVGIGHHIISVLGIALADKVVGHGNTKCATDLTDHIVEGDTCCIIFGGVNLPRPG